MQGLTAIVGIRVGHASNFDALTGCTAILCEAGAVGGVDIRGSASETSSIDTLQPGHITGLVHGIALSGGSAFGLEAACGVRHYLEQRGAGFRVGRAVVPIVPGAVLFDLDIGKAGIRPTREMGESAAAAATADAVKEGAVGAGTGATVGKVFGMRQAMKSGIGSGLVELKGGVLVAALVAVNAFGDVREPATGKLIAGARRSPDSMDLADTESVMKVGAMRAAPEPHNTTLAVVATNARLTKGDSPYHLPGVDDVRRRHDFRPLVRRCPRGREHVGRGGGRGRDAGRGARREERAIHGRRAGPGGRAP
jgi:L-aminopeptidase/D-esterase-like protein